MTYYAGVSSIGVSSIGVSSIGVSSTGVSSVAANPDTLYCLPVSSAA
jgi:hypothetical protein